jgi:hypothetical protein
MMLLSFAVANATVIKGIANGIWICENYLAIRKVHFNATDCARKRLVVGMKRLNSFHAIKVASFSRYVKSFFQLS